jgi:peptidoglycan hydrolase CwlO-like protein
MSPIGRIFIVLNLILAALFMSWAAHNVATSHEYKAKYDDEVAAHDASKTGLEAQLSSIRADLDTKSTEADTFRSERDDAQAAVARIEAQNGTLQQQISEANATNSKNAGALSDIQNTLGQIESAKDEAVTARREAENERDDALSSAQEANTTSEGLLAASVALEKAILDLQETIVAQQGDVSQLETQLATLVDVTGVSYKDIMAQDQIEASVLQALYDSKPGLVALNVGSKDGVKRGYTFEVFAGSDYKGQVRVENVREDMCTALILRMEDGAMIKAGDKAATRL